MTKKRILLVVVIVIIFICIVPIRYVDGYHTYGISLPWFNVPDAFSSHNKNIDALIWNYSDSYINGTLDYDESTGLSLEQLTFERSFKLFNRITIWKSDRLCAYDNGKLIDWNDFVINGAASADKNSPKFELKADELVFEANTGKKDVTVEAFPLSGSKIKSARLVNPQTGEEIQMQSNSNGAYEAVTVIDTDISFDQNRLASDIVLEVYADLEENECAAEIKIRISSKETFNMNYVDCHYFSLINSAAYVNASNEERIDNIDKLMLGLKEQGYLEYYEMNEDLGTLSYEATGSEIPKQVSFFVAK